MSISDRTVAFLAGMACAAAIVGGIEQARIQWRDAEIFDLRADVADLEDRLRLVVEDCNAASIAAEHELGDAHDECATILDGVVQYMEGQCNGRYVDLVNSYNSLVDRYNALKAARRIYHIALPGDQYDGLAVEDL